MFQSFCACLLQVLFLVNIVTAQQYAGDTINNSLPYVPGSEIVYWRVTDPAGKNNNLTLTNYYSLQADGTRLVPNQLQRAVIVIHGLDRDPGTYMSNMLSAMSQQTSDANVNLSSVAVVCPYFTNGDDKNVGYPWTAGLAPGRGSTTNALVWSASQWAGGANNQYPWNATTVSSYEVLDQMVKYFDNKAIFPNMKNIVVAGHSLGGQMTNRYAEIGNVFSTNSRLTYWIGNPNSYAWMSSTRPLSTASCSTYDNWREGYTNFTQYPMSYGTALVASGRANVLARFNSRSKNYARGTQDTGDDSSTCAPFTTGVNRNERFFNFIKAFPPSCASTTGQCDTVDYINAGHDGGAMFASAAGQARLLLDNFYGNGSMAFDFGYPRKQTGDDPFPDPTLNVTSNATLTTYAGNMTYQGCWSDNVKGVQTLKYSAYANSSNTIELCTTVCNQLGYAVAGVEFQTQCFCGQALTAYSSRTVDSGCTQACAGNSSETCGDSNRLQIYSNGPPTQLSQPGTPEIVGNYNSYLCYTEATSGRALSAMSYTDAVNMTLENCAAFCNGYMYFGTEYGQECYCGSYFNAGAKATSSSDCSMTCAGNSAELCGAGNRLTTYVLTSGASVSVISQASSSTTSIASQSSTQSASTSSTSTASVASTSLCPAADGTNILDAGGNNYTVHCSSDSTVGAYTGVSAANTYLDCMTACDAQATSNACQGFVYVGGANGNGAGTCWLKTSMGSYTSSGSNYIAAVKAAVVSSSSSSSSSSVSTSSIVSSTSLTGTSTSSSVSTSSLVSSSSSVALTSTSGVPVASSTSSSSSSAASSSSSTSSTIATATAISCPASNNTTFVASTGSTFLVECGIDHYGGDMGNVQVTSMEGCIQACASTSGCLSVALSGVACYMKNTLTAAVSNANIIGAKFVAVSSSSSSVVGSSSTTLSSSTLSTSVALSTSADPVSSTSLTASSSSLSTSLAASSSSSTSSAPQTVIAVPSSTSSTSVASISATTASSSLTSSVQSTLSTSTTSSSSLLSSTMSTSTLSSVSASSTAPSSTSSSSLLGSTMSTSTLSSASASSTTVSSASSSSLLSSTSSTSTLSSASASSTALPSTFTALGCYVDSGSARSLSYSNGTSSTNTPAQCAANCRALGYKYSGTEYSQECYCGNTLTASTASSGCTMACTGDATQTCGGPNRLSIVQDTTWTQTFFARPSYSTWNLVSCFTDSTSSRTLASGVGIAGGASNATVANCLDACRAQGYLYCGAEYYSECYGAKTINSSLAIGGDPLAAGCSYACSGNKTEACGGSNRILVYVNNGTAN